MDRTVTRACGASLLALGVGLSVSTTAAAGGEGREIPRDADRVYTVVAGEADASATVQNPANLGFLTGVNAIIDAAGYSNERALRGSGIAAFVGVPLPFQI